MAIIIGFIFLVVALGGVFLVVAGYPAVLALHALFVRKAPYSDGPAPGVSMIIVARNAENLIGRKIENSLSLEFPSDRLEILVFSDGSTDGTNDVVRTYQTDRLRFFSSVEHRGKIDALNSCAACATGEVLVFSDVDAMLEPDALLWLTRPYQDADVGGVCGQRLVDHEGKEMVSAQKRYISLDSSIKLLESKTGRVTSNDGKLYAIRRNLFEAIPPGVTDDLYNALSVIRQGYKFIFEPEARAAIPAPSRSGKHELQRRRRIVAQSLHGIFLRKELLNPFRYGLFAFGLLINKVFRRMLPVFMLLFFLSTLILAKDFAWAMILTFIQLGVYAGVSVSLLTGHMARRILPGPLRKMLDLLLYVCFGNMGMFLGIVAYICGARIERWDPVKND